MILQIIFCIVLISKAVLGECGPDLHVYKAHRPTTLSARLNVVKIHTDCHLCTGFIVGKNLIATAAHCFEENPQRVTANLMDGKKIRLVRLFVAKDYEIHPAGDIAILSGNTGNTPPLLMDVVPQGVMMSCIEVGYGGQETTQKDTQCFTANLPTQWGLIQFTGQADFGDSGGPVLNAAGEVIGMTVREADQGLSEFYAVPIANVIERIKKIKHSACESNRCHK